MPHGLPDAREQAGDHEVPEQDLDDDGRGLQVVSVDVDGGEAGDHAARGDE